MLLLINESLQVVSGPCRELVILGGISAFLASVLGPLPRPILPVHLPVSSLRPSASPYDIQVRCVKQSLQCDFNKWSVKKEFILKFARDRRRWIDWLFEAKKPLNLSALNYMVTSNHINLLVYNNHGPDW